MGSSPWAPASGWLFSEPIVLTRMNGKDVLMFRVGNARGNEVVDASVSVSLLRDELSPEGHHFRRIHPLELSRSRSPLFTMTWSVMHEIDEASPLFGIDLEDPASGVMGFIATLKGHDGTYGQTTYVRHIYRLEDLKAGHRFVDVISELPDGRLMIDYALFHRTEEERSALA
ncbi:MAG: hypothetical protein P1V51_01330 [Deltaproteobacteria bacterium]|nr:hypothetical protein [Deltaproteobacteria bacterium]